MNQTRPDRERNDYPRTNAETPTIDAPEDDGWRETAPVGDLNSGKCRISGRLVLAG